MLNKAILQGRIGVALELKQTPNGISVCTFRIVVERNYAPANQKRETDWIDVVAWRQTAEFICKYFGKGDLILVEGSIQTRNYEDKYGNKRTAVEVVASSVYFGGSKQERDTAPMPTDPPQSYSHGSDQDFEPLSGDSKDLPF